MEHYLREWTPLADLFAKLPAKAQTGIFNQDIKLTCVDVLPEFVALGTNVGLVYWYDRKKKDLQRLRCEDQNTTVSAVKIISTVDYMVACGNVEGQISVFQIPKTHPECLPESLKPKTKQVERYTVGDLHVSPITCLEWSKNGMKLFSGDRNGILVLTEIDFYMHLCKSVEILNESYEIVQLSYFQQHLLVSTTYRTIICQKVDKWMVCQVGKKDRKVLGKFGGIFHQTGLKSTDVLVYCSRPGLRIWVADICGAVQQTLLFKDIITQESPEIPLINPISKNMKKLKPQREATFGCLYLFGTNLVTFSNDVLYILDPTNFMVLATVSHCRSILDVAVHKDEIFILEGERSLIRIAARPETFYNDASVVQIPTASTFLPLTNSIKGLTNKLQASSFISAIPPLIESTFHSDLNIETDTTAIVNAEEAVELPPVMKLNRQDLPEITRFGSGKYESIRKLEMYDKIGAQDFDDAILFKHRRRKKHQRNDNMNASVTSLSSTSSDEKDASISRPTLMTISTVGGGCLPDLRSPETILTDIENKERLLEDVLSLNKVKISPEALSIDVVVENTFSDVPLRSETVSGPPLRDVFKANDLDSDYRIDSYTDSSNTSPLRSGNKVMSYGPPSGSSNTNSLDMPACLNVPNVWNLQRITLNNDDDTDSSLREWEII